MREISGLGGLDAEILKKDWLNIRIEAHNSAAVHTELSLPAKASKKAWVTLALHMTIPSLKPSFLR